MALGNKGFANLITGGGEATSPHSQPDSTPLPRSLPRSGILGERQNRLAELANGSAITRVHELVDPARCRIWDGHNRDYAALNPDTCADLLESFVAQGRQEVPAIVRRLFNDPDHDFEVICGARRHWTVGWLRAHDRPEFRYLVEPRELTDEEAFRVADLENRQRKDLSDYERAMDYARAIGRYYDGSQQRMLERLDVSKSWLSRYLELARLPREVLASFGSPHAIGISHAATLAPLLRAPHTQAQILAEAAIVAVEQTALAETGKPYLAPAQVVRRLTGATKRPVARGSHVVTVRDGQGVVLGTAQRGGKGGITLQLASSCLYGKEAALRAVGDLLGQLGL